MAVQRPSDPWTRLAMTKCGQSRQRQTERDGDFNDAPPF
jgi:hypothetical protein